MDDQQGSPGTDVVTRMFEVEELETPILDLSTLPDTPENVMQREIENHILTLMKGNLFLERQDEWHILLASTLHNDNAAHAMDLNSSFDDRANVLTPFAGKVVYNDKDGAGNSTLVIEHTTKVNGVDVYWYTEYLHMRVDANGKVVHVNEDGETVVLLVDTVLSASDHVGFSSNVSNYAMLPHVHRATRLATNPTRPMSYDTEFYSFASVDMRKMLTNATNADVPGLGLKVKAQSWINEGQNGEEYFVRWVESLNAWMNDEEAAGPNNDVYNLIYVRDELLPGNPGNDSYWLAYEEGKSLEEMIKVKWDEQAEGWFAWDHEKGWIKENGVRLHWIKIDGVFGFHPES